MPRIPGNEPASPQGQYSVISSPDDTAADLGKAFDGETAPESQPRSSHARMGFASTGSCFVALTNTILGSGMLGLPHAFSSCGYLLGFFFLVAGGLASSLGLHLLVCSAVSESWRWHLWNTCSQLIRVHWSSHCRIPYGSKTSNGRLHLSTRWRSLPCRYALPSVGISERSYTNRLLGCNLTRMIFVTDSGGTS